MTEQTTVTCPHCHKEHRVDLAPNPAEEERYFSVTDVAQMMGVTRGTVKRWIYDKRLHAMRYEDRSSPWRIPASSLKAFRQKLQPYKPR